MNQDEQIDIDDASYTDIIDYLHNNTPSNMDQQVPTFFDISDQAPSSVQLGTSFLKDLEIFRDFDNKIDQSVFEHVVGCQTTIGRHLTRHIWSTPITDTTRLRHRQKLAELTQGLDIQAALREIKQHEPNLFLLANPDRKYAVEVLRSIVFFQYPSPSWFPFNINDVLNRQSTLLTCTCLYREYLNPIHILISPVLPVILPFIMMRISKMPIDYTFYMKIIKSQFISDGGILKYVFGHASTLTALGAMFITSMWIFLYFYQIYSAWLYSYTVAETVVKFRQHWNSYRTLYTIAKQFYDITPTNAWPLLDSEFNMSHHRLAITLADCATLFTTDTTFDQLLERGSLLQIYYDMTKLIDDGAFHTLFYWIGIMDYYRWINYMVGLGRFQYAKYSTQNKTCQLRIRGCVHPYLKNPVANDVIFNRNRAMLISGPNAGGKSTYMKAVAIHVLFAQTMGFAPGEVTMTPYDSMDTYLHIPDCKGRESLFQAEMNRCIDFIDKVENGPANARAFMMMDEIFTSTNVVEGVEAAHHVLRRLIDSPGLTLMVTTHFEELRQLERETDGLIVNYYVEVKRKKDRQIVFTYRICRGTTTERVALDLIAAKLRKTNVACK